jgi:hypothetical protein
MGLKAEYKKWMLPDPTLLQQNAVLISPPFIIRQSSLMDRAGTSSPDRADANISLFWVSTRV